MNLTTSVANRHAPAARISEPGAVFRRDGEGLEMVTMRWGLWPKEDGGRPFTAVRSEGREFPSHRCLLPASGFFVGPEKGRTRFTLIDRDHFYFAGIWRPASGGWPESYAILTIEANEDVAPFHARQMAVVLRRDRYACLDHTVPEAQLLRSLPPRTFREEAEGAPPTLL